MSTINTDLNELIKKYKTTLRTDIADQLSVYDEINKKYQLTTDMADRFNNCAKFLAYSIVKNSTRIDSYETPFSAKFGRILKKYYNEYVDNQDLRELCAYIYNYNKEIDDAYGLDDISDIDKIKRICKNIYGFNVDTFEIANNSVAKTVYDRLSENDTSHEELYHKIMILDIIFYAITSKNNFTLNDLANSKFTCSNGSLLVKTGTYNIPNTNINLTKYNICLDIYYNGKKLTTIVLAEITDKYITINNCTQDIMNNIKIYDKDGAELSILQTDYYVDNAYNTDKFIYNNTGYLIINISKIFGQSISTITAKIDNNELGTVDINSTYTILSNTYTRYFESTNTPLTSFTQNDISDLINAYKIKINTFKIYYEFNESTTDLTSMTVEEIRTKEKRNSDSLETYYTLQYSNLNYMMFKDLYINAQDDLYTLLDALFLAKYSESDKQRYGFNSDSSGNQNYCILSFTVLYKELNSEIRAITNADVFDYAFGNYLNSLSTNSSIISIDTYSLINEYNENYTNQLFLQDLIQYDDRMIFFSLKTNSYIIRNSNENDLIAYLCGSLLQYGTTSTELDEIETIKTLYKEVRDYFYSVLLNKAFIVDELYDVYKQLYIKAFTIERFISLKTATLHDINTLNADDCKNFLISYGLKELYNQIKNNQFSDSLIYEQRIIANYNNLMQKKGSREILDEFFKIFDYDTTSIEIYKYLLFNKDNSLYFTNVPYNATNVYSSLKKYDANKVDYNTFIADDQYWNSTELPESELKESIVSPVNTKYIGVKLKKDLYNSYIKCRYILSLNDYLYDNYLISAANGTTTSVYDKLTYDSAILENNISIIGMYNLCKILFAGYIYLNESSHGTLKITDKIYYGINRSNTIVNMEDTGTFLTKELLTNLFNCSYIKQENNTYSIANDYLQFYDVSAEFKPFTYIQKDANDANSLLFGNQNKTVNLEYIIPTNVINSSCVDFTNYSQLEYNTKDVKNNSSTSISSLGVINEALSSVSLINFINSTKPAAALSTKNTKAYTDYVNKLKSIYYYYKLTDTNSSYIQSSDETFAEYSKEFDINNTNFYNHVYNKILTFPINYLTGQYFNNITINNTLDTRTILSKIFNTFYTTNSGDAIGYFTSESSEQTALVTKYAATFVKSNTLAIVNSLLDGICNFTISDDGSISASMNLNNTKIKSIQENLTNILSELNSTLLLYENLKLDIQFSENINNLFDFIKTAISFFISYTSSLYNSQLSYAVDTKYDSISLAYAIKDTITNQVFDYFYHDEDVHIDVFNTTTEVTENE